MMCNKEEFLEDLGLLIVKNNFLVYKKVSKELALIMFSPKHINMA
jgi:hypothetical protein